MVHSPNKKGPLVSRTRRPVVPPGIPYANGESSAQAQNGITAANRLDLCPAGLSGQATREGISTGDPARSHLPRTLWEGRPVYLSLSVLFDYSVYEVIIGKGGRDVNCSPARASGGRAVLRGWWSGW